MFIKIDDVNYFVIVDDKSPNEIFDEIFARMQIKKMPRLEKRRIMIKIKNKLKGDM